MPAIVTTDIFCLFLGISIGDKVKTYLNLIYRINNDDDAALMTSREFSSQRGNSSRSLAGSSVKADTDQECCINYKVRGEHIRIKVLHSTTAGEKYFHLCILI